MLQIDAYEHMVAPRNLRTRLLWEDVPTGLAPMVDLARLLGIPTLTLSSLLELCVATLGPGVVDAGWTLESLGITRAEDLAGAF
jgi:opine dehydrogenase